MMAEILISNKRSVQPRFANDINRRVRQIERGYEPQYSYGESMIGDRSVTAPGDPSRKDDTSWFDMFMVLLMILGGGDGGDGGGGE